jgi:hypothetical protein
LENENRKRLTEQQRQRTFVSTKRSGEYGRPKRFWLPAAGEKPGMDVH